MPLAGHPGTQEATLTPRARRDGEVTMRRRRRSVTDGARFTADPGPPEPPRPASTASAPRPLSCWRWRKNQSARRRRWKRRRSSPGHVASGGNLSVVNRSDYGPGIRLAPVRGLGGAVLCDADVVVDDETDPGQWIVPRRRDDKGLYVRRWERKRIAMR